MQQAHTHTQAHREGRAERLSAHARLLRSVSLCSSRTHLLSLSTITLQQRQRRRWRRWRRLGDPGSFPLCLARGAVVTNCVCPGFPPWLRDDTRGLPSSPESTRGPKRGQLRVAAAAAAARRTKNTLGAYTQSPRAASTLSTGQPATKGTTHQPQYRRDRSELLIYSSLSSSVLSVIYIFFFTHNFYTKTPYIQSQFFTSIQIYTFRLHPLQCVCIYIYIQSVSADACFARRHIT